jgi:hypothetical protein
MEGGREDVGPAFKRENFVTYVNGREEGGRRSRFQAGELCHICKWKGGEDVGPAFKRENFIIE